MFCCWDWTACPEEFPPDLGIKALIACDPTLPAPAEMAPAATEFMFGIKAPVPAPIPAAATVWRAAAPIGVIME